jgi:small subunit ribosomal protein S11
MIKNKQYKYKQYRQFKQRYIQKKPKNLLSLAKLHVQANFKNTIISLAKNTGAVLKQWSTKSLKKTRFKKNTPYNVQLIIYQINKYIKLKKIQKLNIYLKGDGLGRYNILKNLKKKKIKINRLFDTSSKPFNGCRVRKMKRR